MCILGAVFIETVLVQQLTDYVWTGGNPYNDKGLDSLEFVARLFKALSVGLQDLKTLYNNLVTAPAPDIHIICSYSDSRGAAQTVHHIQPRLPKPLAHILLYVLASGVLATCA